MIPPESVRYEAGRLALELHRNAESIRYLESVEEGAPNKENLQYLLGLAHGRAGNTDKAILYFQRCLELPNNSEYQTYCQQNLESRDPPAAPPAGS